MKYKKCFIIGANCMLGTTMRQLTDTSRYMLTDIICDDKEIKYCDITNIDQLTISVTRYQPDIIFNFAAMVD